MVSLLRRSVLFKIVALAGDADRLNGQLAGEIMNNHINFPGPYECRECHRIKADNEYFFGEAMWYRVDPVCRHEVFAICNLCADSKKNLFKCGKCGCAEIYC